MITKEHVLATIDAALADWGQWPDAMRWAPDAPVPTLDPCRVYWGSHGCMGPRGHQGPHFCCCDCADHDRDHEGSGCVGATPFYGPGTEFYGEDA